jgi:hypothetical protein
VRQFFSRAAAACVLALAALSCASSSMFQLSADEQAALRTAMDTPLVFVVPRDRSIESWDRAQEFVNRYCSMRLRTVSDSILVTYEEPVYSQTPVPVDAGSSIHYGYSIGRFRDPDGIRITVQCTPSSKLGEKGADQNAHIAADYIRTGQLACERCIVR